MIIIHSPQKMQRWALRGAGAGRSIGFVPTMGALHAGHRSLIKRARRENDKVVVSVFVNPTQFGPAEDWARYPRPRRRDERIVREEKGDVVFRPSVESMYPEGFQTWVRVEELSKPLCGVFRPGHFEGVATVMEKLLQIVRPHRLYMGRKDFQQLRVIERLVSDLCIPVKVVRCPTVRDKDGLALSSRNADLTPLQRRSAAQISHALQAAVEVIKSNSPVSSTKALQKPRVILRRIRGGRVDYLSVVDPISLRPVSRVSSRVLVATAVRIGRTRLIDNRLVRPRSAAFAR